MAQVRPPALDGPPARAPRAVVPAALGALGTIGPLGALALLGPALGGCATDVGGAAATSTTTLTVLAAASLRGTFTTLERAFEDEHPGVDVVVSFAGSSDLVTQVLGGAPADVVATADLTTMGRLVDAGLVAGRPAPFASNTLTVVVPPGNPGDVASFADLARPGLAVVLCAPQVPCGATTARLEEATGVDLAPVSEESSVTGVLTKVVTGEADAGVVYVTDALAAGDDVETVPVPQAAAVTTTYPAAVLADSRDAALARGFVDLLTGSQGRQVLAAAGFAPAP